MVIEDPYYNKPLEKVEEKPKEKFLGITISFTWTKWKWPILSFKVLKR